MINFLKIEPRNEDFFLNFHGTVCPGSPGHVYIKNGQEGDLVKTRRGWLSKPMVEPAQGH